jgi:small subunit ribosomal protein S8
MSFSSDPIGDFLTRMRNAQAARKHTTSAPWSRIKQELCELLQREGFLADVRVTGETPKKTLEVSFVEGKVLQVARVSRPGRRVYSPASELKPVLRGFGVAILTTSQGLMTDKAARQRKVGGEVLCTIA